MQHDFKGHIKWHKYTRKSKHTEQYDCKLFFHLNGTCNSMLELFNSMGRDFDPSIKVHLTPKNFFRLNNSLHLFETHCAFLPLFSPNLDSLQALKVKKSGHHLFHNRASKGYGSIPGLMSQTYLHACLQRLNTMHISL